MLPHKSKRGAAALARLKVFEGVPPPYDKVKRVVVPDALRVLRLRPGRRYTVLGQLAEQVGWKFGGVVSTLEEKRKVRGAAYHQRKKALNKLRLKASGAAVPATKPAATKPAATKPATKAAKPATKADDDSDSDFNLSDDDDDEETKKMMAAKAEATRKVQERQAEKAAKGTAKSDIAFDIKPAEVFEDKDANDKAMQDLLGKVRSVELEGMKWMSYQFIDVAFGIKKLRIMCQIIDIKVPGGPDEVKDLLEAQPWCEEIIQSIDVFSFQMAA